MRARHALCTILLALSFHAASAQELEVIDLNHRLADDVIPVIEPLLAPGGVLTGMDDKLFVRTSPANLAQIRTAVRAIDVEARQLLLSVGQSSRIDGYDAGARASVGAGSDGAGIGVNQPPGASDGSSLELRAGSRTTDVRSVGSVRTLEGQETYLAVGQSVPITSRVVGPGSGQPGVRQTTTYRDTGSGFYATARLSGEFVTVEISPYQQSRPGGWHSGVHSSSLSTRVSGRVGEWIPLGGMTESRTGSERGLLLWGENAAQSGYVAWVKVDELR